MKNGAFQNHGLGNSWNKGRAELPAEADPTTLANSHRFFHRAVFSQVILDGELA
jgi:hypothetical protein